MSTHVLIVSRRASISESSSIWVLWCFERVSSIAMRVGFRLANRRSLLNRGYRVSANTSAGPGLQDESYRVRQDFVARVSGHHKAPVFHTAGVANRDTSIISLYARRRHILICAWEPKDMRFTKVPGNNESPPTVMALLANVGTSKSSVPKDGGDRPWRPTPAATVASSAKGGHGAQLWLWSRPLTTLLSALERLQG